MGERQDSRGKFDNDTRLLLIEGDVDVLEAKLAGLVKGIWALVLVVTAGVIAFIFQIISAGVSG